MSAKRHPQGQTDVVRHDTVASATSRTAVLGLKAPARVASADHALMARRCCVAHGCRDGAVVCGRVELTVAADSRLGLTPRERRSFTVRFLDGLEPGLRSELITLVRRRGAAARRAAERMQPIEIVFDDPLRGLQRIAGSVQPPQRRNGVDLRDIAFGLRAAGRAMTDEAGPRLSSEEIGALKFAAHRQLSRSANRELRPRQQARRDALLSAVRVLADDTLRGGCQLLPTPRNHDG